ncbi:MAG: tRNA lysidine(34) synthetase TilS [SAR202 cluster bacterium]|nr:tRNA lysidine(34) synthetase TilS [SAR202 cluster bacterium]
MQRKILQAGLQDTTLVAAVSGGPDSLALLHLLARLQTSCGLSLHVAHLDHALRDDSADDARFVQEQAWLLGLPFICRRVDVLSQGTRLRLGLEQAAREVRYAFLAQVAQDAGAAAVALGHTADDQAETVLHRIVRGTGLRGLRGMGPVTTLATGQGVPVTLFRPLLSVTRQETEALCRSLGLTPRHDPTNEEPAYTRNFLRNHVLPLMRQANPQVREALLRLGRNAALQQAYLEGMAADLWPSVATHTLGAVVLDRAALLRLHPAVRRELLRRAYAALAGLAEGLEEDHLEAMESTLEGRPVRQASLPHGLSWRVGYKTATIGAGSEDPPGLPPPLEGEWPMVLPGRSSAGPWTIRAQLTAAAPEAGDPFVAVLDAEALGASAVVRAWRPGDRFQPLGLDMSRDKRLQDFFSDARVARELRHRVPLVVTPRGVAWVVGLRIAHWARITPQSTRGIRLECVCTGGPGVKWPQAGG